MTDRELLELAAKAAGVDGKVRRFQGLYQTNYHLGVGKNRWNPLTDDGDALRLAVKLSLEIDIHFTGIAIRTPNGIKILISAEEINDPYAATRRAITRAAAEIGRSM